MLSTPNANPGNRSNAITARSVQGEVTSFLILRSPSAPGPYARSPVVTRKLCGSLTAALPRGKCGDTPRRGPSGTRSTRRAPGPSWAQTEARTSRVSSREPSSTKRMRVPGNDDHQFDHLVLGHDDATRRRNPLPRPPGARTAHRGGRERKKALRPQGLWY